MFTQGKIPADLNEKLKKEIAAGASAKEYVFSLTSAVSGNTFQSSISITELGGVINGSAALVSTTYQATSSYTTLYSAIATYASGNYSAKELLSYTGNPFELSTIPTAPTINDFTYCGYAEVTYRETSTSDISRLICPLVLFYDGTNTKIAFLTRHTSGYTYNIAVNIHAFL